MAPLVGPTGGREGEGGSVGCAEAVCTNEERARTKRGRERGLFFSRLVTLFSLLLPSFPPLFLILLFLVAQEEEGAKKE